MRLAPGTTLGPYRIVSLLGSGGMGEVYRALDPRLGRDVAVKVLLETGASDPDRLRRFEREARAASALQHPGILTVFDVGSADGVAYVVSELLEGTTLRQRLGEGALPPELALDLAVQTADALAAAHEGGVVHRDIKPENLFITRTGRMKVLDFGLAKVQVHSAGADAGEGATLSRTTPGLVMGTAGYMSPEQVRGADADSRSDVFSFGTVLYEMLSGRRAFRGNTLVETLASILHEEPPPLSSVAPGVPAGLAGVVGRCLRKTPGDRYPAGRALHAALTGLDQATTTHVAAGTEGAPATPARSWRWPLAMAAALAALVVAGIFVQRRWGAPSSAAGAGVSTPSTPNAQVSAPDPPASEVVTFGRLRFPPGRLDELQERLRSTTGSPQIVLKPLDGNRLQVSGPHSRVVNAVAVLKIRDALDGYQFGREPSLFRTGEPSSRLISFGVSNLSLPAFLQSVAAAAGWPIVVDRSVAGPVQLTLNELPWDKAVRTILDVKQLTTTRFGAAWLVSSRERAREIAGRELPLVYRRRPRRTTPESMAAALEPARSDNGVIAVNRRLGAVVIADRAESFPAYGQVVAAIDRETGSLGLPQRVPYEGRDMSLDFVDGDLEDVFRLFADFLGINVVVEPGITGRVTLVLPGIPAENALDLILRSQGLSYELADNVLRIFPEKRGDADVALETVALAREDPDFFKPFARCLTPAGALQVDARSRTLVIRDVRERATWLRRFAEETDRDAGR